MALTQDKFILPDGSPITGVQTTKSSALGPSDLWDFGIYDYRDSTTLTTPISLTGGSTAIITNDGLGSNNYILEADLGPSNIWDTTNNRFDFTSLNIGDMIDIRLDLEVTTTSNNQTFSIDLEMGQGGTIYTIPFVVNQEHKTAGAVAVNRYNGIYLRNANLIDNPAQFKISSASNLTLEVHGWYCKLVRKGRNI